MTWKIRKSGMSVFTAVGHSLRVTQLEAGFRWEVRPLGSARTKQKNKGIATSHGEAQFRAIERLREIVADGLSKLDAGASTV